MGTEEIERYSGDELKELYGKLLGLPEGWRVEALERDKEGKKVVLEVGHRRGMRFECSECGKESKLHDHGEERVWRHLDTMDHVTEIRARVPRVRCAQHGVRAGELPWAQKHSRWTQVFQAHAIELMGGFSSVEEARKKLGISWEAAQRIMEMAVERGLARRELGEVKHLGLDEKSFLKGQSYVTVCNDIGGKRVLEVEPGRDTDSGKAALGKLPAEVLAKVEAVAVDLCPAYAAAVGERLPEALLVADKFHVTKLFNEMIKVVRRDEHALMSGKGDGRLKNTRILFLKRRENHTPEQSLHFDALACANLKTSKAWLLRENFSNFWNRADYEEAVGFFDKWYRSAIRHKHKEIKKLARTLRENLHKLVNHITSPITNAFSEGINSKIQAIKAAARGFRSFKNYRTRILFFCGKLDLSFG